MTEHIERLVDISPDIWPGKPLEVQPGDLCLFAPPGRLEDNLSAGRRAQHDDRLKRSPDPFRDVPISEPAGGIVYLRGDPAAADISGLIRLLRINGEATDYAAFADCAADPLGQRYLTQLRVVRAAALATVYDAISPDEMSSFPVQRLTIAELLPAFIAAEQARWRAGEISGNLSRLGTMRDHVVEALGFGLMVENAHYGIYRMWSRSWLDPR